MTYHAFTVCDTGTYRAKMLIKHVIAIYVLVLTGKYIALVDCTSSWHCLFHVISVMKIK